MRFLNWVPPSLEAVPSVVVRFVGEQLGIEPGVLGDYGRRPQTRDDHVAQIRVYLQVRAYEAADATPLRRHLVEEAMRRDDAAALLEEAEAWLRRQRILFPSSDVLRRVVRSARVRAEWRIYRRICGLLSEVQKTAMQALLETPHGKRGTRFSWLKEPPRQASSRHIRELTDKLHLVRGLGVGEMDLSWLVRNRARQLAGLGRNYSSTALERFAAEKRYAILTFWLQELQATLTDDIVTMLNVLIGRLFTRSENAMQADQARQGPVINWCLITLRKAVGVLLDRTVSNPEVRPMAFEVVPEAELQRAYDSAGDSQRPEDYNSLDYARKRHRSLRSFLPCVLDALKFTGNQAAEPVLRAVAILQEMRAEGKRKLPPDTLTDFADESWREAIQPDQAATLDRPMWELALAEKIRDSIKSSDLYVVGSWQHRDWTSYLLSPEDWELRRDGWWADWHAATDPRRYLDDLEALMDEALQRLAEGWEDNDFASQAGGRLKLSRDDAIEVPASAEALKKEVQQLMPRIKLTGLLPEVDAWIGLRDCFSHPSVPAGGHNPLLEANFFAVLVAHGCNLALTNMADSADLPYHHLTYLSDWYFREECRRAAIVAAVNYHHSLALAGTFGPGTAAMTDGIRFGVSGSSLMASHHPRYFGVRRGITVYDMTSDQYSHPYVQVIGCHEREAAAALDAALRHETDLPLFEHMTDTHGYTEIIFGLFELEGRMFSPRLRDLPGQVLYPMSARQKKGPMGWLLRGRRIRRELIERCWDDMHRVAASLKEGTVTATLLVAKFQAMKRMSGIQHGLQELGRIHKTLFILRYRRRRSPPPASSSAWCLGLSGRTCSSGPEAVRPPCTAARVLKRATRARRSPRNLKSCLQDPQERPQLPPTCHVEQPSRRPAGYGATPLHHQCE
ncbi:MAG: Tn3 family transposase [Deltaproteobacteria bacterium]|nr:Tn3 family transposase [Deltaproteobacteria bacterium]